MDKVIEALKKLLPEDQVKDVTDAVQSTLEEAKAELEKEFNERLEEAYSELYREKKEAETVAESGYEQAHGIIEDLRLRLETQREEFESTLEENYEEAYQMLVAERGKNENIEVGMYEEYDGKLSEMKEYMVDKVDQFLHHKGKEIYEQARRDVINDPRMAEHRVALDKIVDVVAGYVSDENCSVATSTKLEEAERSVDAVKGQVKILEAKNIRLSADNKKLNEAVAEAKEVISEYTENAKGEQLNEQKERAQKAKGAEGKGEKVAPSQKTVVIHETTGEAVVEDDDEQLAEAVTGVDYEALATLAGLRTPE
tara:strand:- start:319 stop:1254 length:936 start_codon:yes stop_codon:yes gene_type:complete